MGVLLAKFRKQKTTYQVLEKLEEDMKEAEALTISTREKQRRFIVNLYLVSIGLFILGCILYYFYLPPIWSKRIVYAAPLFVMLILVICLGRLGSWFFQKRLNKNLNKLSSLREEKKKIIEKVMDTETYKVAIELLNRFGDKNNGLKTQPNIGATPSQSPVPLAIHNKNLTHIMQHQIKSPQLNTLQKQILPTTPVSSFTNPKSSTNPSRTYVSPYNTTASNYQLQQRTQVKTPFPIINQNEKNIMDKILDFLIGEGQSSQYGMVCKDCFGHNGMVSFEDYEYLPFRCAFCKVLNPAKKMRPIAPAISVENIGSTVQRRPNSDSSSSSSDRDSGSDSEQRNTETSPPPEPTPAPEPTQAPEPTPSTDVSQPQPSDSDRATETTNNDDEQPLQPHEENLSDEIVTEKSPTHKKID